MKATNTMTLTFDSLPVNEGFARSAVAGFFAQLDPTVEELCDIRTAVSEAVTNSIVHGYRQSAGKVREFIRTEKSRSSYGIPAAASKTLNRQWNRCIRPTRKENVPGWDSRSCNPLWILSG